MKQEQHFSFLIQQVLNSLITLVDRTLAAASGFVDPSQNADSRADDFHLTLNRGGSLVTNPEVVLSFIRVKKKCSSNYSEFKQSHNVSGLIRESYQ